MRLTAYMAAFLISASAAQAAETSPGRPAPAPSPDDMMMAVVGIPSLSPQTQTYTNFSPYNKANEKVTVTLNPQITGRCELTINSTRQVVNFVMNTTINSDAVFTYNFSKMTGLTAAWEPDYEEALDYKLFGGPRKPRDHIKVVFKGDGAACEKYRTNEKNCENVTTPGYHIIDKAVSPARMIEAFARVRAACGPPADTEAATSASPHLPAPQANAPPATVALGKHKLAAAANLRATPSRAGALAAALNAGDDITVVGVSHDGDWYHVSYPGGLGWILARVLAKSTAVSTPGAKPPSSILAQCPGAITSVEVEADAGKFNPPAMLTPTSDNGRTGNGFKDFRAEWTGLARQNVVLHCRMGNTAVDVPLPPQASTCLRSNNLVTCR